jgi:hypothetical protein
MSAPRTRLLWAGLIVAGFLQLGGVCADPGAAPADVSAAPDFVHAAPQDVFSIEVLVSTPGTFRAIDFQFHWDPAFVSHVSTNLHGDFDDDGQWASAEFVDAVAGRVTGIRDINHAEVAPGGEVGIITASFRGEVPGTSTITIVGGIADGQGLATLLTTAVDINVGP